MVKSTVYPLLLLFPCNLLFCSFRSLLLPLPPPLPPLSLPSLLLFFAPTPFPPSSYSSLLIPLPPPFPPSCYTLGSQCVDGSCGHHDKGYANIEEGFAHMTVHPVISCRGAERGKEREMKKYDESGSQKTTIQYNRTLPREGIVFHLKPSYIQSSFSPHIPILALLKRKTTFTHVAMQLVDTLRVDTDESRTLQLRRTKKTRKDPTRLHQTGRALLTWLYTEFYGACKQSPPLLLKYLTLRGRQILEIHDK